jgi:Lon protease-like protein
MSEDALRDFSGTARLFPLPNLVLFPHVLQPLHIFEPRYRQMTADALAGDRFLTLVLPRPGAEAGDAGQPALHAVACLGRIVAEQRLADGRYNLLLRGLSRVRIVEELVQPKLYRQARGELLGEVSLLDSDETLHWRRRLIERVPHWLPEQGEIAEQLDRVLRGDLPLGALADVLAFTLPLAAEQKQKLLEERNVVRRLGMLLAAFEPPRHRFPPEFSAN